jgi:competence protein ComEA
MKTWQGILFGTFLGLAASAAILLVISPPRGESIQLPPTPTAGSIAVYITGAVNSPGVVYLPRQSRILNAIEAAGGLTSDADFETINPAARINDGERITIYSQSSQATRAVLTSTASGNINRTRAGTALPTVSYPININTASQQDIESLPNIGPAKASQIITYRQQNGPFKTINDIQNVPGIGPVTFEKLKDLITVDQ